MKSPSLLRLFCALSLLGLAASVAMHIASFFGIATDLAFVLHLGVVVVFPLALSAARPGQGFVSRVSLKEAFQGAPRWAVTTMLLFEAYAVSDSLFFFVARSRGHAGPKTPQELRGFSGLWMLFYAGSAVMFYAALCRQREAGERIT